MNLEQEKIDTKIEESVDPGGSENFPESMYEIPGRPAFEKKDFERYAKSKEKLLENIPETIRQILKSGDWEIIRTALELFPYATAEDQEKLGQLLPSLIRDGLNSDRTWIVDSAARFIPYCPKNEQDDLYSLVTPIIQERIGGRRSLFAEQTIKLIPYAPENIRGDIIERVLHSKGNDQRPYWVYLAAEKIRYAEIGDRGRLIDIGLKHKDWDVRKAAAENIPYANEDDQKHLKSLLSEIIRKELENEFLLHYHVVFMIKFVDEKEQEGLRRLLFEFADKHLGGMSHFSLFGTIEMIKAVSEDDRAILVDKMYNNGDEKIRAKALELVHLLPVDKQADLVSNALLDNSLVVRTKAATMIAKIPDDRRFSVIKSLAENNEPALQLLAVDYVPYLSEADRKRLFPFLAPIIKSGLLKSSPLIRDSSDLIMSIVPESETEKIRKLYEDHGIGIHNKRLESLAERTSLYNMAQERFFRKEFTKNGSRTTLLDAVPGQKENTLRGKVIMRHISFPVYISWSKAFEAHDFWKEHGFDYVPVEPIIRVKADSEIYSDVMVFSGVLGPSVTEWERNTNLFWVSIEDQIERIRNALSGLGIEHGHTHRSNFCLVFERTEKGQVDLTKPPRVYLIDFDEASSPGAIQ